MLKRIRPVLGTLAVITLFAACSAGPGETTQPAASLTGKTAMDTAYKTISPAEAKDLIGSEGVILVDVRTSEEYEQEHIPQAILLPVDDISRKAQSLLPDKDPVIIVYCRSGRRSKIASAELIDMGYKRVYDLGGILDWPYDTVSG